MRLFRQTNINFLKIRQKAYWFSTALIVAGLVSLFVKGIGFGIDFRGGTELVLGFEQPVEIGQIRSALAQVGLAQSEIKTFGSPENILVRTTEHGEGVRIGDRIREAVQSNLPESRFEVLKEDKIGPRIGEEMRRDAVYAVIASLIVILGYIAIRFKFVYGVGAVAALFHDVLVTLGIISILDGVVPGLNLDITQEVFAAFLTLVGISVNDTVVVFDRIRENLKIYRSMSLQDVMNRSLNDTLSRTIITQGTVLLVLVVLVFLGGEVTRGFAFTLAIGTIAGTYSSIYIASAIVLDWSERKKKQASS
jgi:preprotein translocase SecF subunit